MFRLRGHIERLRADKRVRCETGSALVEFALSAGLILCLFFAVIEFGYALYSYQFVTEVTRELTRYAIVRGSSCGFGMPGCGFADSTALQTYAQSTYNYPGFDLSQLTVTATWYAPSTISEQNPTWNACASSVNCNGPGHMIQVTVQYPFLLSIPFWKATTLNVTSTSTMVISQ
jgi:Flp pilus assembly protein TadG